MKLLVVLIPLVALAAGQYGWKNTNINDWNRDSYMHDLGMNDRIRDNSYFTDYRDNKHISDFASVHHQKTYKDSSERLDKQDFGGALYGVHSVEDMHRFKDVSMEKDHTYLTHGGTYDNVDKKFAKYDDILRTKILNDKDLLFKQKFILDILRDIFRVWTDEEKIKDTGRLVYEVANYKNYDKVVDFFRMVKSKDSFLPRGRVFSVKNMAHVKELRALFDLFYYSKNFDVFKMNVLWARKYINEELFVHALIGAVLHRDDTVGIKLPAIYEILPHKFHTSMTIDKAMKLRKVFGYNNKDLIVLNKFTTDYQSMNEEGKLAYLTEDIGWNMFNYWFHMDFAAWIGGKDFKLAAERRGEKYFWIIQQILARYNLERYAHGLGDIKDITLRSVIETGYNPLMKHFNGLPVTYRRNYYDVRTTKDYYLMTRVADFGGRIRDAIDKGYCLTYDGGHVDLKRDDGIDVLGNLIHSNLDSVNNRYYGGFVRILMILLGGGYEKNIDDFKLTPSVMENHETVLRDPVTYQLFKKLMKFYYHFKDTLPTYKKTDLLLDGVRVLDIKTSQLVTYFDQFNVDISNIVDFDRVQKDSVIWAQHMRLNHKPFTMEIKLNVQKPQKVVVRTFLGPKFDVDGKLIELLRNRENFVEIDKFTWDLKPGQVLIERNSREFVYVVKDRSTYFDIYKKVLGDKDLNKLIDMHVDEANCGFPDRLLLPKGWNGGMPLQMFVIVTKAKDVVKDVKHTMICGKRTVLNEVDDWALGFPFDRKIDVGEFYVPNMLFKDVFVYHDLGDFKSSVDFDGKEIDSKEKLF